MGQQSAVDAHEAGQLEMGGLLRAPKPSVRRQKRRHQGGAGKSRGDPTPPKAARTPQLVQCHREKPPERMAACMRKERDAGLTAPIRSQEIPQRNPYSININTIGIAPSTPHQALSLTSTVVAATCCPPFLKNMTGSPSSSCGATCPSSASSRRSRSATLYLNVARDHQQRSRMLGRYPSPTQVSRGLHPPP